MTGLRVWAPRAGVVELEARGSRRPMGARPDGWWEYAEGLAAGTDYRLVVDGRALPDPRSPFQPEGVHGPSRTVDHAAFGWSDAGWRTPRLRDRVIYELHVGTFSPEGTFDGVIERLDHLLELGVDVVELMPVAEFAGDRGWGYDGVDLYAPHHSYGGPDGLKRLVDACHGRGLGVVLDVVYNHLGPEGNYLAQFGPYFTDSYPTPWGQALNLDGPDSQPVRDFLIENALMWLRDYHLDGLRLDAVHALFDSLALHFLEELATRVATEIGPERWLLPESDRNDPRLVTARELGGHGLTAHWCDDVHHAIHTVLTGEREGYYADYGTTAQLATALRRAYVYAGEYSPFRRRRQGRRHHLDGDRFVVCVQNHDQVGNRARGERLGHLVSPGRLRIAAALLLCSPFVPMLFMGEEWDTSSPFPFFSSHTDPALAAATTRGRIAEFAAFGWSPSEVPDPQDPSTFDLARPRWDELGQEGHRELLDWYRALLRLRRSRPDLRSADLSAVEIDRGGDWLLMRRGGVTVVCNWSGAALELPAGGLLELASDPDVKAGDGRLVVPPDAAAVLVGETPPRDNVATH
jgi:maltooligosyltrehalose trehalohydrolase